MKIHSDIITSRDIRDAVPGTCFLAPFWHDGDHTVIAVEGSRSHGIGYLVRLSGSSPYAMQHTMHNDKAATWDEWGNFIMALFAIDPRAKCGQYDGLQDFIDKTTEEHERIKEHRRDLLATHSAPWLAQRSDLRSEDDDEIMDCGCVSGFCYCN
jgi:hypothetical protein